MKKFQKRCVSGIVAVVVLTSNGFPFFPDFHSPEHPVNTSSIDVKASEVVTGTSAALQAIGISPFAPPDGYQDSNSSPYGKTVVTATEVNEIFFNPAGSGSATLFGHNNEATAFSPSGFSGTTVTANLSDVKFSVTASGDFGKDEKGRRNYIAVLYVDKAYNLKLGVRKADETSTGTNDIQICEMSKPKSASPSNGNVNGKTMKYQQNYNTQIISQLKIATGDFDGDGADEIAFYNPNAKEIQVYKYTPSSGSLSLKKTIALSGAVTALTLSAGDVDSDGYCDLAVCYMSGQARHGGIYKGNKQDSLLLDECIPYTADMLKMSGENISEETMKNPTVILADVLNTGSPQVVVAGTCCVSDSENMTYYTGISLFSYDKNTKKFNKVSSYCEADSSSTGGIDIAYHNYGSSAQLIGTRANQHFLLVNGCVYNVSDTEIKFLYSTNMRGRLQINDFDRTLSSKQTTNADFVRSDFQVANLSNGDAVIICKESKTPESGNASNFIDSHVAICVLREVDSSNNILNFDFLSSRRYSLCDDPDGALPVYAVPNTDNDTTYMEYTGNHSYEYSDPQILTILASPPHFNDLLDQEDGNYAESSTSYAKSSGSGDTVSASATIEVGAYVKIEEEGEFLGIELFHAEAETHWSAAFTAGYEESNSYTYTQTYSTTSGADGIVLYTVPIQTYEYTVHTADGKVYNKKVCIPQEPVEKLMELDDYRELSEHYSNLPQISDGTVTHTVGKPETYPTRSTASTFGKNQIYGERFSRVGFTSAGGGQTIGQSVEISKEKSASFNSEVSISVSGGVGAGGVVVGVEEGASASAGYAIVNTTGVEYSAEMQNMPKSAEPYGYNLDWQLFAYDGKYTGADGKEVTFPVVSYIVNNVTQPPQRPQNLVQNYDADYESDGYTVTLEWDYDGSPVNNFNIYRLAPNQDESEKGTLVGSVKGNERTFTDKSSDLVPYQSYRYHIEAVRSQAPSVSMMSDICMAYTKGANEEMPKISFSDCVKDGVLTITPTTTAENQKVKASVDSEKFTDVTYQWQRKTASGWVNFGNQVSDTIDFSKNLLGKNSEERAKSLTDSDIHFVGEVRCFMTMSYPARGVKLQAYSEPFTVKRTLLDTGLYEENSLSVELRKYGVSLKSVSGLIPTGTVTFHYKSNLEDKVFESELRQISLSDGTKYAVIDPTGTGLSSAGSYTVTVQYSGDNNFNAVNLGEVHFSNLTYNSEERVFICSDEGMEYKPVYWEGDNYTLKTCYGAKPMYQVRKYEYEVDPETNEIVPVMYVRNRRYIPYETDEQYAKYKRVYKKSYVTKFDTWDYENNKIIEAGETIWYYYVTEDNTKDGSQMYYVYPEEDAVMDYQIVKEGTVSSLVKEECDKTWGCMGNIDSGVITIAPDMQVDKGMRDLGVGFGNLENVGELTIRKSIISSKLGRNATLTIHVEKPTIRISPDVSNPNEVTYTIDEWPSYLSPTHIGKLNAADYGGVFSKTIVPEDFLNLVYYNSSGARVNNPSTISAGRYQVVIEKDYNGGVLRNADGTQKTDKYGFPIYSANYMDTCWSEREDKLRYSRKISDFFNIELGTATLVKEGTKHQVTAGVENGIGGTVQLSVKDNQEGAVPEKTNIIGGFTGSYEHGKKYSVEAVPDIGYTFQKWVDQNGNTVSTTSSYGGDVDYNINLTAVFAENKYNVNFTNHQHGGMTITEDGDSTSFEENAESAKILGITSNLTLMADKPAEGYHFAKWSITSGGNEYELTSPMLHISGVTSDVTYTPVYERDSYKLTLGKALKATYMLNGVEKTYDGEPIKGDTKIKVSLNDSRVEFANNTCWRNNNDDAGYTTDYEFTITADTTISHPLQLKAGVDDITTIEKQNIVAPTCEKDGSHDDVTISEITGNVTHTEHVVDPATGHSFEFVKLEIPEIDNGAVYDEDGNLVKWGDFTRMYNTRGDFYGEPFAIAYFRCKEDGEWLRAYCNVTEEVTTQDTCEQDGLITFTATLDVTDGYTDLNDRVYQASEFVDTEKVFTAVRENVTVKHGCNPKYDYEYVTNGDGTYNVVCKRCNTVIETRNHTYDAYGNCIDIEFLGQHLMRPVTQSEVTIKYGNTTYHDGGTIEGVYGGIDVASTLTPEITFRDESGNVIEGTVEWDYKSYGMLHEGENVLYWVFKPSESGHQQVHGSFTINYVKQDLTLPDTTPELEKYTYNGWHKGMTLSEIKINNYTPVGDVQGTWKWKAESAEKNPDTVLEGGNTYTFTAVFTPTGDYAYKYKSLEREFTFTVDPHAYDYFESIDPIYGSHDDAGKGADFLAEHLPTLVTKEIYGEQVTGTLQVSQINYCASDDLATATLNYGVNNITVVFVPDDTYKDRYFDGSTSITYKYIVPEHELDEEGKCILCGQNEHAFEVTDYVTDGETKYFGSWEALTEALSHSPAYSKIKFHEDVDVSGESFLCQDDIDFNDHTLTADYLTTKYGAGATLANATINAGYLAYANYAGYTDTVLDGVTMNVGELNEFSTDSNIILKNNSHLTIDAVEASLGYGYNTISIEEGSYLTLSADALNSIIDKSEYDRTGRLNQLKAFLPIGWSIKPVEETRTVTEMEYDPASDSMVEVTKDETGVIYKILKDGVEQDSVTLESDANHVKAGMNVAIADGAKVSVNLYFKLPEGKTADEYTVEYKGVPFSMADCKASPVEGFDRVFEVYATAKEMGDDIPYAVKNSSGQIVSEGIVSVKNYAKQLIDSYDENVTDETKASLKAMLNYGTTAQIYFDHNTESLANSVLEDDDKLNYDEITIPEMVFDKEGMVNALTTVEAPVSYYGMNLTLENDTTMTLYFKNESDNIEDAVDYMKEHFLLDDIAVTPIINRNYLMIRVENISIRRLEDVHTLKFDESSFEVSVAQYFNTNVVKENEKLQNLCKALHHYYETAKPVSD